jgi:hypothetical protein
MPTRPPPVSDCPGSSSAPRQDVARSRSRLDGAWRRQAATTRPAAPRAIPWRRRAPCGRAATRRSFLPKRRWPKGDGRRRCRWCARDWRHPTRRALDSRGRSFSACWLCWSRAERPRKRLHLQASPCRRKAPSDTTTSGSADTRSNGHCWSRIGVQPAPGRRAPCTNGGGAAPPRESYRSPRPTARSGGKRNGHRA